MAETYENLMLVETQESILIHPAQFLNTSKYVIINRVTDAIQVGTDFNRIPDNGRIRTECIAGIIGIIDLIAGPYLILIKTASRVGTFNGLAIWQMKQYELMSIRKSLFHLSEKQRQCNQAYLDMLDTVLRTPYFYFSTTYDLSHNFQSLNFNSPHFFQQSILARADERFIWNSALVSRFMSMPELHSFCVPLIHGFVSINEMIVNSHPVKLILISRRSCRRAGTRMFSRGMDSNGNTSNLVETEQIIEFNREISSFVQIRGSIPLYWSQKPNLRYKPPPKLAQRSHSEAFVKHFEELTLRYNRIVCIDLINQTGSEAVLETAFAEQVQASALSYVRYEAFDFHHECQSTNWDRLDILINRLTNELDDFTYFLQSRGQRKLAQGGVFRTNCIDCLDRTNVVQGMLARLNLERVLRKFGILRDQERIADHHELEFRFKNIWADNGDIVSIEYSGTGALKSDFTRTGKRSYAGAVRDGYNSAIRYIMNNFADGHRQDAMDLFLGNYVVDPGEGGLLVCSLEKDRDWKFFAFPLLLIISIIMATMMAVTPSEYTTETLLYLLFWGSMFLVTGGVILSQGREYVDNPVLCAANDPTSDEN